MLRLHVGDVVISKKSGEIKTRNAARRRSLTEACHKTTSSFSFYLVSIMSQPSQLSWNLDTRRFRSYILRIPLATRLVLIVSTAFFIAGLFLPWLSAWAALTPQEIALTSGSMFYIFHDYGM